MTGGLADVLVVGAGPTGLALAAQLAASGVRARLIDRSLDRVRESRALAIQPRTLEVLAGLGVTDELIACGNPAVQRITVERGVELAGLSDTADAAVATLHHRDGRDEVVLARYVVGCDGAGSSARRLAEIPFRGSSYPQTFVLADIDADGVEPGAAHVFVSESGMLLFFPLGKPAPWRLMAMRPPADRTPPEAPVVLADVQALASTYTGGTVQLHDPVWMTNFRLHQRAAARYRADRVFLAGDAAHIHSPAGAQGMNTGIQDAINLGWKLAQTLRRVADPALLDSYEAERAPIGKRVLRLSDRAFTAATSTNQVVRLARTRLAPALIPLALKAGTGRAYLFRTISQLNVRYRDSCLSLDGPSPPRSGPRAGDRIPDASIVQDGRPTTLHRVVAAAGWHLLLCGPPDRWTAPAMTQLRDRHTGAVTVHQLSALNTPGALHDPAGQALRRLGLGAQHTAQYLVRPDGHVGYRAGGTDLSGLARYLGRWLPGSPASTTRLD